MANTGGESEPAPGNAVGASMWSVRYPRGSAEFNRLLSLMDNGAVVALTLLSISLLVLTPQDDSWRQAFKDFVTLRSGGLIALIVSFVLVGVFWLSHHHLLSRLVAVDRIFMMANLFFLFQLTLTPVAAVAMAEHAKDIYAVVFYGAWLAGFIAIEVVLCWVAYHRQLFASPALGKIALSYQSRVGIARLVVAALAMALAYVALPLAGAVLLAVGMVLLDVVVPRPFSVDAVER